MTFIDVMAVLIGIGGGFSTWLFRKGGPYNPHDPFEAVEPPVRPENAPERPVEAPKPPRPTLKQFLTAIRDFEGLPGDANYLNNNPGNCRYNPGGYHPMYGNVKKSPAGFAIFPTYELGWLYLNNMVKGMIKNHPDWTIERFMFNYAPPEDHNPTQKYAAFIGKRLGVDAKTFLIRDLA